MGLGRMVADAVRDDAPDLQAAVLADLDRAIERVVAVGFEPYLARAAAQPLHHEFAVERRDHDLPAPRRDRAVDDGKIAVVDAGAAQTVAADADDECGRRPRDQPLVEVEPALHVICGRGGGGGGAGRGAGVPRRGPRAGGAGDWRSRTWDRIG